MTSERQQLEQLAYALGRRFGEERKKLDDQVAGIRAELEAVKAELEEVRKQLPPRVVGGKAA
jgi:predicted  nucleic acid-binding Zn-ribbon protein